MGAHEAVRPGDETRPLCEGVAHLAPQGLEVGLSPGGVVAVWFHGAMPAVEHAKPSRLRGRSAVRSGILTGLSFAFLSLSGGLAGAVLAHKFGRDVRTDGFMAAYAVYLVLVLGAQAFRMVVVPDLTRADAEGRLGAEFRAYVLSFLALALPVCALVWAFSGWFGELVTGRLPQSSAHVAADALVWLVPAAFGQLLASLAASAPAAPDSYAVAAGGFALRGVTRLVWVVLALL